MLLISAFIIIGFSAKRLYGHLVSTSINDTPLAPDFYFFAGFALTSVLAGTLSVFIAIDEWVSISFVGAVLILAIIQYRLLWGKLQSWIDQLVQNKLYSLTLAGVSLVLIVVAVFFSYQGMFTYDTGLYHTQSIKWIKSYPAVPGLGNLHGRLAFNSMFFPISALFQIKWHDWLLYPLNSVVFVIVFTRLMLDIVRAIMNRNLSFAVFYSLAATGVIVLHLRHITGLSTDVISSFLTLYIIAIVCRNPGNYLSKGFFSWILIALIFISATYKLSAAFLVLLLWPVFKSFGKVQWAGFGVLVLAIFSPFFLRNFILSGYLIYPFPAVDIFSPDWKVPLDAASVEQHTIKAWAMIPLVPAKEVLEMSFSEWIPRWWDRHNNLIRLLLLINVISAVVGPILMVAKKEFRQLGIIHLIVIVNCVFWFVSAPDPRFAYGFLISNAAILLYYLFQIRLFQKIPKYLLNSVLVLLPLIFWPRLFGEPLKAALSEKQRWITPSAYDDPVELTPYESPFEYYKPRQGDRCFDAPLPCTPYEPKNVAMRGRNLEDGFQPTKDETR